MAKERVQKFAQQSSIQKKRSKIAPPSVDEQSQADSLRSPKIKMSGIPSKQEREAIKRQIFGSWAGAEPFQALTETSQPQSKSQESSSKVGMPIQTKLTIGEPGDKYEQEADRVASLVVKQINTPTSQQSTQSQPVQRQELSEENEELQRKPAVQLQASAGGMAASAELESAIQQARSGGQPLADNIRQSMEQAFGADFSGVKVHTDSQADQLNRATQARAFTTGQDVFFRQGEFNPGSRDGQELLAHELTHVVQQSGGAIRSEEKLNYKLINLKGSKEQGGTTKVKGEDYANNVGKLINQINEDFKNKFIDEEIKKSTDIISSERPKCSFFGKLDGEDTNQRIYSTYCEQLKTAMKNLQELMSAEKRLSIKTEGFTEEALCKRIISELPTQAIDQRVRIANSAATTENRAEKIAAMDKIDHELKNLATAMNNRIKSLLDQKIQGLST